MNKKLLITLISFLGVLLIVSFTFSHYAESQIQCTACVYNVPETTLCLSDQSIYPYVQYDIADDMPPVEELLGSFDTAFLENPVKIIPYSLGVLPFSVQYPNYITDIMWPLCSTYSEELRCVGLYPDSHMLWAVVEIKRTTGYGTDLCGAGILEYITFWIDWDNNNVFENPNEYIGMSTINVHEISNSLRCDDCKHDSIYYTVSLRITNPKRKCCWYSNIVKVRAILSRHIPQNNPNFCPFFGNILDRWVNIKPRSSCYIYTPPLYPSLMWQGYFTGITPQTLLPPEFEIFTPDNPSESTELLLEADDLVFSITPGPDVGISQIFDLDISSSDLDYLYADTNVEEGRQEYHSIMSAYINPYYYDTNTISEPIDESSFDLNNIQLFDPGVLSSNPIFLNAYPSLSYLWSTYYEEIQCVGFDPDSDQLTAIIKIKRPCGYNGNPCTKGSREYVRFWIDWDCDGFDFSDDMGTTYVTVHDKGKNFKSAGLYYAASLKIPYKIQRSCNDVNVYPVRAVLSWNLCPSPDPDASYHWGSAMDRCIQIKPADIWCPPGEVCPYIYEIGGMDVDRIHPTSGYANGLSANHGFTAVESPFGGIVSVYGNIINVPNFTTWGTDINESSIRYKLQYRRRYDDAQNLWTGWQDMLPKNEDRFEIKVRKTSCAASPPEIADEYVMNVKDGDGFYSYYIDVEYCIKQWTNFLLLPWDTSDLDDGLYEIRMVIKDEANFEVSDTHRLVLDNTYPTVILDFENIDKCAQVPIGTTIRGSFSSFDQHLDTYWLIWSCGGGCGSDYIEDHTPINGDHHGIYNVDEDKVLLYKTDPNVFIGPFLPPPAYRKPPHYTALGRHERDFRLNTYHEGSSNKPNKPCGYYIKVWASDRAIINNHMGNHHRTSKELNFCLLPRYFFSQLSYPLSLFSQSVSPLQYRSVQAYSPYTYNPISVLLNPYYLGNPYTYSPFFSTSPTSPRSLLQYPYLSIYNPTVPNYYFGSLGTYKPILNIDRYYNPFQYYLFQ